VLCIKGALFYYPASLTTGAADVEYQEGRNEGQADEQDCDGRDARRSAIARRGRAEGGAGGTWGFGQCGRRVRSGAAHAPAELPPKTVSQILGEITWLMTQSPRHKAIPLGDLEWFVMPAILLRQFRIFYQGDRPVGVAIWALVDDLVAKRIDANDKRLTAVEWKSGANKRIIDVVAPFGGEVEMRGQVNSSEP
jgi:cytolysin-activating lysine-acyltransferase